MHNIAIIHTSFVSVNDLNAFYGKILPNVQVTNVYEMFLGRPSLVHAEFNEMKAYWEGRRDEVVGHYKRDIPDLTKTLDMDLVMVQLSDGAALPGEGLSPLGDAAARRGNLSG